MRRHFRLVVVALALIIIQTAVVPFISIATIIPDVLMIWIVFVAIRFGQIPATIAGFSTGLLIDLIGGQFIGLFALSKTIAGFLAGYFYNENKIEQMLGSYQFLIVVGFSSFVHNVIYFVIAAQGGEMEISTAIFRFGLFSTFYTAVAALFPLFFYSRKIA